MISIILLFAISASISTASHPVWHRFTTTTTAEPDALEVNPRYRLHYHLSAPYGWINDPNGFSIFNGTYHLFYQYNPFSTHTNGRAHWGHAKSHNLIDWQTLPIALRPDEDYDTDGVFSGSAVDDDGVFTLIYTGQRNQGNDNDSFVETQNLATSEDGVHFEKYVNNPVLKGDEKQPNFRDPKVWRYGDKWYMVVGNQSPGRRGRALLYSSHNLRRWQFLSVLAESDGSLGYMWECPDFFELEGKFVLLISPQGMKAQGDKYKNLYQTGYLIGSFSYETNNFDVEHDFVEFDRGHDFYATETTQTTDGRRVVVAWMSMWNEDYPEERDGWAGGITLPRELSLGRRWKLTQKPVREAIGLQQNTIYNDRALPGQVVRLRENRAEIIAVADLTYDAIYGLIFHLGANSSVKILYDSKEGKVLLDRGGPDGVRRASWKPARRLVWRVFLDGSSLELFCGSGELVFTSRIFPSAPIQVAVKDGCVPMKLDIIQLRKSIDVKDEYRNIIHKENY